jgi:hypothetical protein
MDVTLLDKTSLRIKSKYANFIVDPFESLSKISSDAVIVLSDKTDLSRVTDYRVIIKAPGEYEVGGIKISGIDLEGTTVYGLTIDGIDVLLAKTSSISKISEKLKEYEIAIFNVDSEINQSVVTALEPRIVILYGEKAKEAAKAMGKESAEVLQKFSASDGKLPEEMQVVVLN